MATAAKTISLDNARADDAKFYWLDEGRSAGGFERQIDHSTFEQGHTTMPPAS
jgi:hypothetical protein